MKVLILCWERPLYLWASLDSLYRHTRTDVDFVLMNNHSQDPLVAKVLSGFNRRGMFSEIVDSPTNDPLIVEKTLRRLRDDLGEYVAFVETDVLVERGSECWVATMARIMDENPKLAMLGSQCDKSDFVDVAATSSRFGFEVDDYMAQLLKANSPERSSYVLPGKLGAPHNPPGRLLMLRSTPVIEVGFAADGILYGRLQKIGYEGRITGDVIHRHLSLLNFYDYPDYDVTARAEFMTRASDILVEES
jgi:GT2 family glycosyltransferase